MSNWHDSNFQTYKEEQGEESCPHGGGQPAPAQVTVTCVFSFSFRYFIGKVSSDSDLCRGTVLSPPTQVRLYRNTSLGRHL